MKRSSEEIARYKAGGRITEGSAGAEDRNASMHAERADSARGQREGPRRSSGRPRNTQTRRSRISTNSARPPASPSAIWRRERTRLREKMNAVEKNHGVKKITAQSRKRPSIPKSSALGDSVQVLSMNLKGTVSTLPDAKGNLFVQMGILRSQVNLRDLEPHRRACDHRSQLQPHRKRKNQDVKVFFRRHRAEPSGKDRPTRRFPSWISIWTTPTLPTFPPCGSFTEKAPVPSGKPYTTISAAARYVDEYHLGEFGEGDAGVTIVTFKK